MKRWKKVVLVLLGLLLLSQTPFIYRRYRLGRLHATIEALKSERAAGRAEDPYADYRGVIHVHSALGGHSTGGFEEIVGAARSNELAFVIMTEHPARFTDTAETTLKGFHEGVLFINGSEMSASGEERLLIFPGGVPPAEGAEALSAPNLIGDAKGAGRLVFVAYPEQFRSWEAGAYDGLEIYNLYTNSKKINYGLLFFDGLWSYWSYPHLMFSTFYERPEGNLKKWDELTVTQKRKLVAIAGNDAHANVGLSLQHLTGKRIMQLKLDPYERSFRVVRTHVVLERGQPLSADAILSALAAGHCFISFDLFGDGSGFRFTAESAAERKIMGDEIGLNDQVRLAVNTPVRSRLVFFRDGQVVHEARERTREELTVDQRGVYRVEVYLDQLGKPSSERPWIISNPIYVR